MTKPAVTFADCNSCAINDIIYFLYIVLWLLFLETCITTVARDTVTSRIITSSVAVLRWGQGAQPPNLAQANLAQIFPIFRVITVHKLLNTGQLDTVVLLVVASQMMRGQARPPNIFFLEPPLYIINSRTMTAH